MYRVGEKTGRLALSVNKVCVLLHMTLPNTERLSWSFDVRIDSHHETSQHTLWNVWLTVPRVHHIEHAHGATGPPHRTCSSCQQRFSVDKLQRVQDNLVCVVSATSTAHHQLDYCYGACAGCQSGGGSTSNSPNFVTLLLLYNSQATLLIWSAHSVNLVCCDHPHRSFCQFPTQLGYCCSSFLCCCTVTLELSLFHWTVELQHPLTHLRSILSSVVMVSQIFAVGRFW